MSTFKIDYTKISKTIPIDGADRVELAQVDGMTFQFVVGKGQFKIGEPCFYFPVDSVLPQPLIEHFGIGKFLSGKDHNRVKTGKFLKQISQGYVATVESVMDYINTLPNANEFLAGHIENADCTKILGVTKYEAQEILEKNAILVPLSGRIESYDIEGSQRNPEVIEYMMNKKICVSEKCEGMNGGFSVFSNGEAKVNQHNFFIELKDGTEHIFWNLVKKYNLENIVREIQSRDYFGKSVTLRFEVIGSGIQNNIYNLKGHDIRLFDIEVENEYIDVYDFLDICNKYNLPTVPILAKDVTLREWLNGKTFEEAAHGKSVIAPINREGIVCKTMIEEIVPEEVSPKYKRCIVKNRSTIYLNKSEL